MTARMVPSVDVLGCPFSVVSYADAVEAMRDAIVDGRALQIVPANVDFVMKARRSAQLRDALAKADLIVADGVPVTWAARLLRTPLRGRVSGTDLVLDTARLSAELGVGVAIVGSAPGIAAQACDEMNQRFPGARLHTIETPAILELEHAESMAARVRDTGSLVVLVALGAPKQEQWVQELLHSSGAVVGIGCGSALDIISGAKPRAPRWMCDNGLEWLHRLRQEPRRLGRRYLIEDAPFIGILAVELIAGRIRRTVGTGVGDL
jgi:N-acetylglucosaminyldiphosphoundecaprenol N-acetyl-beta-D-mannosaminyltransferase